jgi:hypothetical protein
MKKSNLTVMLKTTTWARDSHGLYDYDTKNIAKTSFQTNVGGVLFRKDNEVCFEPTESY